MSLEIGKSLLSQCKRLKERYSNQTADGYELLMQSLQDYPLTAHNQLQLD